MEIYPRPLENLIEQLTKLPGIGQKSATRVALYILRNQKGLAEELAKNLLEVKEKIRFCPTCFNFTDQEPCAICRDTNRANGVLCVVEGPGDQLAIEESGIFKGRYHILHGVLSPLDHIGPEDLKIGELLGRLEKEEIREVVLATNPTTQGEVTASYLAKILADKGLKVTRIALGIPMGGDLKYIDPMTLRHSFNSRITIEP
ncbi:MAG: recombination protein RecR [Deltaproteobacteria bacterium]|nr:recombination protein RecR [Deltaproteobacteria bacterium]